jgi:streptomycin 6-kinase
MRASAGPIWHSRNPSPHPLPMRGRVYPISPPIVRKASRLDLRWRGSETLCPHFPERLALFGSYLDRWHLVPDGDAVETATSRLLPVRADGAPAILKVSLHAEEKRGNALMVWWAGRGSAPVLAHEGDAVLLARADDVSLADLARAGRDDEASRIMCAVLAELHAQRDTPPPHLVALEQWFAPLYAAAHSHGGAFRRSASAATDLMTSPREIAVLHGDMHHGNVLHFGARGWLAIDPKALLGERYFDYANMLCNPDYETASAAGRLRRQVQVIAEAAKLEPARLITWIIAWAGLSAAFFLEDGLSPERALAMAELAAAELNG